VYPDMNDASTSSTEVAADHGRDLQDDFGAYVRATERQHKRLAFLLTGDLHEAEDLLQASYAKMYPHWRRVRKYDVPDAYLRRVMVSVRTSWWRRSRNREWTMADIPERVDHTADPAALVIESRFLLVALRELPVRQRTAVVLRHWCDLSEAATATAMGCSLGTVKSNTSKGLARLRTALGQAEGTSHEL
jgi:RNA polymerase sigma-70 factor (sigma-E family)